MPKAKQRSNALRTIHYYWQVTSVQWPMFSLAVISTLGFIFLLSYMNPLILGKIVDIISESSVEKGDVFKIFGPLIILLIANNVIGQTCSKLQDYSIWKLEIKASYKLATLCFDTLSNQSMTFHSNRFGGSLVSQTQKFMSAYALVVENLFYGLTPIVFSAIFTIALLAPIVPLYVLILAVLLIVYVTIAVKLFKRILPLNDKAAAAQNVLSGELSDSVTNILSVKTYGREKYERSIFDKANQNVVEADTKRMRSSIARGAATSSIIVAIMAVAVIFISGGNAWFGISAGSLVMIFTYTYSLTMQFNHLNVTLQQLNRGFGDAHDMTDILDEPTLVGDCPNSKDLVVTKGTIEIKNLSFEYTDSNVPSKVFDEFSLEIPAGQRVGIVGRSGSGKTTLTKLLLRLSDIQSGTIEIDGQDISKVKQVSLRHQIAYVPQEPLLFHRSIAENIAYGKPDATFDEVLKAANDANATEFIEKLPNGFDTLTGERGVKLSGGQRQRIAIARAILANAPILILDEATSALDSESEKLVQDALKTLMRGRTSIVIAHRLSTVASLERIVVLDDGKIIEDGSHEELIKAGGQYSKLWNRQTGAFLNFED